MSVKFGIIGAGVVGTTIATLLNDAGCECIGVNTRSNKSYERFCAYLPTTRLRLNELARAADILFITTQDGSIEEVAIQLTIEKQNRPGQIWIHCSGSLRSEIMCKEKDLPVGYLSIHPLQAFANIDRALLSMQGTHFGIEGNCQESEELGEALVEILGGIPHKIDPTQKTLYHAGAVAASNYLVSLAYLAVKLFEQAGIDKESALQSLLPLMSGSYHNIEKVGLPYALTGPIARGDTEVVRKHLQEIPWDLKETYKGLGRLALEVGEERNNLIGGNYNQEMLLELKKLLGVTRNVKGDEDA
ncbi:MAG: glycerol-3-phosphate dehydrogenase [Gracilibacter sp. BRH_c7a]|nr:MAG: glycerol-3-phosphate dehydrogenase [Gracilibacter sp. BRH_c7a]